MNSSKNRAFFKKFFKSMPVDICQRNPYLEEFPQNTDYL